MVPVPVPGGRAGIQWSRAGGSRRTNALIGAQQERYGNNQPGANQHRGKLHHQIYQGRHGERDSRRCDQEQPDEKTCSNPHDRTLATV